MSQSYYISACSTVDLTNDYMKERNIPYVSFQYFLDEVPHKDDMGESMSLREFYDSMREGSMTSTSQVSIQSFRNASYRCCSIASRISTIRWL